MKRFAVPALLLLLAVPALASYISLNTKLTSQFERGKLKASVEIVNKGDEAACNVQAEFRSGGLSVLADKVPQLPVDLTYKAKRELPLALSAPGTYPLALIVHYTDANQYPFSALTLQTFVYREEAPSPLASQLGSATIDKEGGLTLRLKNFGSRPLQVTAGLVVPAELTAGQAGRAVVLEPNSDQSVSFSIKNFSALAGSTYQVFAVAEFEDGGRHFTAIAPGLVKISNEPKVLGLNPWAYFVILVVLVLAFFGAQFLRKK